MSDPRPEVLRVDDLKVHFPLPPGLPWQRSRGAVRAVDGVSFTLRRGETLGLVGESGCGKSTTGLAALKMLQPTAGRVVFEGEDITDWDAARVRPLRRRMQMVYQDPYGSLNPRMRVRELVGEPLTVHRQARSAGQYRERVAELLATVGLLPDMADRYPHEFSGGQRQRIGIARALALEPSLLICDEPVSALDVSIQAQILNLMKKIQRDMGLTYIFITHNLSVVNHFSDDIAVMYLGRLIEKAPSETLFEKPLHPYTQALLSAIPVPRIHNRPERLLLRGEITSPINPEPVCRFANRCNCAMPICSKEEPGLIEVEPNHFVACHLVGRG